MTISIGIAGAGQFAPSFLRLWAAHPDVHEVRLADVMPDRLAEMGRRGRELGQSTFSWSRAVDQVEESLRRAVSS